MPTNNATALQCPACSRGLRRITVDGIVVDACEGGCGGIWFDNFELQKFDEPHEAAGENLLEIARAESVSVDHEQLSCPTCDDQIMMRHFFSTKNEVEVDECPACGGFWLDAGELRAIRTQFGSEAERQAAAREYFQDVFGDELAEMREENDAQLRKSQRIARMFRFICPTNYIPGDQSWGAF